MDIILAWVCLHVEGFLSLPSISTYHGRMYTIFCKKLSTILSDHKIVSSGW
jgi:hypothetical protein